MRSSVGRNSNFDLGVVGVGGGPGLNSIVSIALYRKPVVDVSLLWRRDECQHVSR